jgi:CBS domain containing-hemolysin-like protein
MVTVVNLIIVFFLVLANGFFVASEFALVGVRRSRIATLAENGSKPARRLLRLIDHLNAYISATQLGITLASLALGWLGEPAIARLLEGPLQGWVSEAVLHTISFTIAFSIITFLHIVLGELAPKTLALERAEKTALAIALPMEIFYKIFSYPIRLLDWAGTRTVRLFGLHPSHEHGSIYTEDEIKQVIRASHQSGYIKEDEEKLINRVFDFSDAEVCEAMVPRTDVAGLEVTATLEEAKQAFRRLGYTRLPVYRKNLDYIIGVLHRRDLEPYLEQPPAGGFQLQALLHAPVFIPATARLSLALRQMQSAKTHLAFVTDEHGGVEGIITLEDLLEEIVGEIDDEFDEEVRSQIVKEKDAYVLDGMLAVRDANRRLQLDLPEEAGYTTIAGFLLAQAGRLLRPGDVIHYHNARFEVRQVERHRIKRIRFTPVKGLTQNAAPAFLPVVCEPLMEHLQILQGLLQG